MAGWSPRGSPALGPTGTLDLGRGTECGQKHPPKDSGGALSHQLPPFPAHGLARVLLTPPLCQAAPA